MSQFDPNMKRAVALKYDEENNPAPVIVASGLGYMAERIVEAAVENNVPVFEDNSLSTVLSQLDLGAQIPEELYQAVVDIYVYFLHFIPGQQGKSGEEGREKVKVEIKAHQETPEAAQSGSKTGGLPGGGGAGDAGGQSWEPPDFT